MVNSPRPEIRRTKLVNMIATVTTPAKNFPFITASLYIGWDRSFTNVPEFLSLFIESKPNMRPIKGPKKAIN